MPLRSDFMGKRLILYLLFLFTLAMLYIYHEHRKVQLEAMVALNEGKFLIQQQQQQQQQVYSV